MYLRLLEGPPTAGGDAVTYELELGTTPNSRAAYRLAPENIFELKKTVRRIIR